MKTFIALLLSILITTPAIAATAAWDPSEGATGYTIEMWNAADPETVIGRWNTTQTNQEIADTKFMPGVQYSFRVFAFNTVGVSGPSETTTFMTDAPAYEPPGSVTPPDVTLPPPPGAPAGMTLESATYTFVPVP